MGKGWSCQVRKPLHAFSTACRVACWVWKRAPRIKGGTAVKSCSAFLKSSSDLASQSCVSLRRRSSGCIKQLPFSNHSVRKRSSQRQPPAKVAGPVNEHVHNGAPAHQCLICRPLVLLARRRIIGDNDQDIVVAVQTGVTTGSRTEKVYPLRLIGAHQPANHVSQYGIVGRRNPSNCWLRIFTAMIRSLDSPLRRFPRIAAMLERPGRPGVVPERRLAKKNRFAEERDRNNAHWGCSGIS